MLLFSLLFFQKIKAQCAYTCSNYAVYPITFTTYPATGNTLTLADDDVSSTVQIGFTFQFFCINNTMLRVCSNGFLTFDLFSMFITSQLPYAQSLPTLTNPNAVIAWNWNDLDPSVGGSITYTTIGTSPNQKFILTYTNVPMWSIGGSYSGQIVLHETTNIVDIFTSSAGNNGWLTHTQGIEDFWGTAGYAVPGRNLTLWNVSPNQPSAWRFSPYTTPAPGSISGPTLLCEGTTANYSVVPASGALGYLWQLPNGWTGTSTTAAISATPGVTGNVSVAAMYTCAASAPVFYAVTVTPAPFVSVLQATPQQVCTGDTVFISMTGANSYTLQPGNLVSNGFLIPTPFGNTTFSITGTDTLTGCTSLNQANVNVLTIPSPTISVNSGDMCLGNTFTMQPLGADGYSFSSIFPVVSPTVAGTYSYVVIGTSSVNGCNSLPAISHLTVHALPTVTAAVTRSTMCTKETTTLLAGGATTYSWNNGFISPSVIISPTTTSTYTVWGENEFGCAATATVLVKVTSCQGIVDNGLPVLTLYPNPASEVITLTKGLTGQMRIYDMEGRILLEHAVSSGTLIDISPLPEGLYQVVLFTSNYQSTQRLIIQRR
jgi:hypothetical protein